jgi:transcriptional regulator with XRE-family HTH domain
LAGPPGFPELMMKEYNVGAKLKKLRLAKNLTIQSVANEIGVSPSLISQIEHHNVSPPIATLSKLAKFFGVRMSSLFTENEDEPKFEIIRKNDRKTITRVISREGTNEGYSYETFSFKKRNREMEPFLITLSDKIEAGNLYSHEGESFIYVINGSFEFLLEEDGKIVLREGDSVYFETSMEHGFRPKDGSGATILQVCWRS